jgi:hypothetical protein
MLAICSAIVIELAAVVFRVYEAVENVLDLLDLKLLRFKGWSSAVSRGLDRNLYRSIDREREREREVFVSVWGGMATDTGAMAWKGFGKMMTASKSGMAALSSGLSKMKKSYATKHEADVVSGLKNKGVHPRELLFAGEDFQLAIEI